MPPLSRSARVAPDRLRRPWHAGLAPSRGSARLCAAPRAPGFSAAGCGTGSGVSDSKIVEALDLKQTDRGYEMGGDPFCTIDAAAQRRRRGLGGRRSSGAAGFVIAGPDGEVGVVAQRPFAPDCTRRGRGRS